MKVLITVILVSQLLVASCQGNTIIIIIIIIIVNIIIIIIKSLFQATFINFHQLWDCHIEYFLKAI